MSVRQVILLLSLNLSKLPHYEEMCMFTDYQISDNKSIIFFKIIIRKQTFFFENSLFRKYFECALQGTNLFMYSNSLRMVDIYLCLLLG